MSRPLPITIITGYVGSGKTTLILNLLPQLKKSNPSYRLALIKNEIGDLNVDSQLASSAQMAGGTRELLGACICCTNVGQIGESIAELERDHDPDRIVIETSGSAEPIKLVMEIKRLSEERRQMAATRGSGSPSQQSHEQDPNLRTYELDGIISVIDVQNWTGYASTSFTAKLQARQTDLIVLNKWEDAGEQACETCLDRLGDMDVETPHVKSDRGWINKDLLFGLDVKSGFDWDGEAGKINKTLENQGSGHDHQDTDGHGENGHVHHMEEMECLSITLTSPTGSSADLDLQRLEKLLATAPKDEIFRIKALLRSSTPPSSQSQGVEVESQIDEMSKTTSASCYILNWAFGRYTWTRIGDASKDPDDPVLRMSIFTARYESNKWQKRLETGQYISLTGEAQKSGQLVVKKVL